MVLPGFVSGHEHLIASGWTQLGVKLGSGQSKEDYLKLIKEYADATRMKNTSAELAGMRP